MRLAYLPTISPMCPVPPWMVSTVSYPKTTSAMFPSLSGTTMVSHVPPRSVKEADTPFSLVNVYRYTFLPSFMVPKSVFV